MKALDKVFPAEIASHTPGPWEYVPGNEHHGPYVTSNYGSTICDCYTMSHPSEWSTASGGRSKPVLFLHEMAEPNARLIAAAPEMLDALQLLQVFYADSGDFPNAAFAAMESAIAKATGAQ